jgi:hypothetical protein
MARFTKRLISLNDRQTDVVLYNGASCRSPCNCGEVSPRDVNLRPVLKLGSSVSLISHRQPLSTHHLSQGHNIYPLRVPRPSLSAAHCAHIARSEYNDFTCIPPALTRQPGTSRFACPGLLHSRSAVSRQDFRPSPKPKVRPNAVVMRPLDTSQASPRFLMSRVSRAPGSLLPHSSYLYP